MRYQKSMTRKKMTTKTLSTKSTELWLCLYYDRGNNHFNYKNIIHWYEMQIIHAHHTFKLFKLYDKNPYYKWIHTIEIKCEKPSYLP